MESLLMQFQEPPRGPPLPPDTEKGLNDVLWSLEKKASGDNIRSGHQWMKLNAKNIKQIACALRERMADLRTFAHKLHVLYLVHDVIQVRLQSIKDR